MGQVIYDIAKLKHICTAFSKTKFVCT